MLCPKDSIEFLRPNRYQDPEVIDVFMDQLFHVGKMVDLISNLRKLPNQIEHSLLGELNI
jgi:hypothetical protein